MKKLAVLVCLLSYTLHAQPKFDDYDIELGPFFKVSKRSVPIQFIGNDESGFYLAYAIGKTGMGEVSLKKFGYDLKLSEERVLKQQVGKETAYTGVIFKLEDRMYQFLRTTSFSSKKIYLQEIKIPELEFGELQQVATVTDDRSAYHSSMAVHFSRDSSHIALIYTIPNKRKENERFGVHVFDRNMEELWNREFELPYTNKLLDLATHRIDDAGNLHILGKRYFGKRREKVAGQVNYDFLLFSLKQDGAIDSIKIGSEGKYLRDMQVDFSPEGDIISAGFYSDKSSLNIGGAFYLRMDGESGEIISSSFKEFEVDFLTQNMTANKAKRVEKRIKEGKDVELPFYFIDEFLVDEEGRTKIIAERRFIYTSYVYSPYGSVAMTHYNYGDIMVIDIDPAGSISWATRIAKNQQTTNDRAAYSSYSMAKNEEYTYLIFNDNATNLNYKGVGRVAPMIKGSSTMVMLARLDGSGEVKRDALFDRSDVETKVRPALCEQLNDREMLLFGHKGLKTQRFILLRFK